MTSSMTSSFQKSCGFIYSLRSMYMVSLKFIQALLLFKIARQGKKTWKKKLTVTLEIEIVKQSHGVRLNVTWWRNWKKCQYCVQDFVFLVLCCTTIRLLNCSFCLPLFTNCLNMKLQVKVKLGHMLSKICRIVEGLSNDVMILIYQFTLIDTSIFQYKTSTSGFDRKYRSNGVTLCLRFVTYFKSFHTVQRSCL